MRVIVTKISIAIESHSVQHDGELDCRTKRRRPATIREGRDSSKDAQARGSACPGEDYGHAQSFKNMYRQQHDMWKTQVIVHPSCLGPTTSIALAIGVAKKRTCADRVIEAVEADAVSGSVCLWLEVAHAIALSMAVRTLLIVFGRFVNEAKHLLRSHSCAKALALSVGESADVDVYLYGRWDIFSGSHAKAAERLGLRQLAVDAVHIERRERSTCERKWSMCVCRHGFPLCAS